MTKKNISYFGKLGAILIVVLVAFFFQTKWIHLDSSENNNLFAFLNPQTITEIKVLDPKNNVLNHLKLEDGYWKLLSPFEYQRGNIQIVKQIKSQIENLTGDYIKSIDPTSTTESQNKNLKEFLIDENSYAITLINDRGEVLEFKVSNSYKEQNGKYLYFNNDIYFVDNKYLSSLLKNTAQWINGDFLINNIEDIKIADIKTISKESYHFYQENNTWKSDASSILSDTIYSYLNKISIITIQEFLFEAIPDEKIASVIIQQKNGDVQDLFIHKLYKKEDTTFYLASSSMFPFPFLVNENMVAQWLFDIKDFLEDKNEHS